MSIVIPTQRRTRIVVAAAAAVASLFFLLLALRHTGAIPSVVPRGLDRAPIEVVDQAIEQAPWKVKTFPAGTGGKPARSQMKAIEAQSMPLKGTVTAVYDALLLQPAALETMAGKELTQEVTAALVRSKLTPSADLEDLQTTKRTARIGIDAHNARHAAARIEIVAKGSLDSATVKFRQEITMWLERTGSKWKVVAFEGSQKALR